MDASKILQRNLLLAVLIGAVVVGAFATGYNLLTVSSLGLNDFLSRWEGARTYWIEDYSPYSIEADQNIQQIIFGRLIEDGEDPQSFAYPFWVVFLLRPLVGLEYQTAATIWMVLSLAMLVGVLALTLDILQWRPPTGMMLFLLIGALLNYPSARGVLIGQPSHLVVFMQVVVIWAAIKKWDLVAGVALFLATMKPQTVYFFVPFMLIWSLVNRRYRLIGSFVVIAAVMFGLSFAFLPTWLSEWLDAMTRYTTYTINTSGSYRLLEWFLGLPTVVTWIVNVGIYAMVIWFGYVMMTRGYHERLLWIAMLIALANAIVSPRTTSANYAMWFIVMTAVFAYLYEKHYSQWATLLTGATVAGFVVLPWSYFAFFVDNRFEPPGIFVILPWAALALLLVTRRGWWRAMQPYE